MEKPLPLQIYCKNCGAPAGFDIVRQTFACSHCGEVTGLGEARQQIGQWRELCNNDTPSEADDIPTEEHDCPSCGARIVFPSGEASETCDFCGSNLIRGALSSERQMPEVIIPFFITPEEARTRMLQWSREHRESPEGKKVGCYIGKLQAYYLPYQLVRGPIYTDVSRDGTARRYRCAGCLDGIAVNTSRQLDNLVLNEMEPYDWSAAQPFHPALIAGQKVKLNDLSDEEIAVRVREEAGSDFLPTVEKVMQTQGVELQVEAGQLLTLSALLPVYFIQSGRFLAVMNGQTGRIAVSGSRTKTTCPWIVEPMLYTVITTLGLSAWYSFAPEAILLFGCVFTLMIFSLMGDGRHSIVRSVILRTQTARATRENGELKIEEGKNILKNPWDNTPVFYEPDENGKTVPVRIRFYTFGRWLSILLRTLLLVFLPAVIAAGFRLLNVLNTEEHFTEHFNVGYGAAWYVLAGFVALMYLTRGVRRVLYDHPILYEILPDGRQRLMGHFWQRQVGILSIYGLGQTKADGTKIGYKDLWHALRELGGIGIFLIVTVLILLLGSTAAICN